jgi:SAM-dependent methyltransferase
VGVTSPPSIPAADEPEPSFVEQHDAVTSSVSTDRPNAARIHDHLLGGAYNFAVDRRAAAAFIRAVPDTAALARANRAFLARAVRYLASAGVRQYLDLGCGIPTVGSVHTVAQRTAPGATVVYVDVDPVAVACSRAVLAGNYGADAVQADLRHPDTILDHPRTRRLLDLDRPVAVLLVAVLHFVLDDPQPILARLHTALAPGSYLVISHFTADERPEIDRYLDVARDTGIPATLRSRTQIEALFAGFDLVEPGLVPAPLWRPDSPTDIDDSADGNALAGILAAVGRKP